MTLPLPRIANDTLGQEQEARTNFEIGTLGGKYVDIEPYFIILNAETDHAPLLDEIIGFPNSENRSILKGGKDPANVLLVVIQNEQDLASA